MSGVPRKHLQAWRDRFQALQNIPPVLVLLWESGRLLVTGSVVLRTLSAIVPVSLLWVTKLIVDAVVAASKGTPPPGGTIFRLLAAQFALAAFGVAAGRGIDYLDARIADEYSRTASLRIMDHAAKLDLARLEDPAFHDVLERARVQATDRIAMLQGIGRLIEQTVTLASLSIGLILFSPGLFALLFLAVAPAFLGESHFAFLGYSLAHSLTPVRRELEYLRLLGTSKESAKELRIFGLAGFLRGRFARLTDGLIGKNRRLARRRLAAGTGLAVLSSVGYYGGYAYLVMRALRGELSIGSLTFLAGALAGCSGQLQSIFSTFSGIADQALYLTDLLQFFSVQPRIVNKVSARPAPRPIRHGFEFQDVSFAYPHSERAVLKNLNFRLGPGERVAIVGENGQGKTTLVKLLARLYDPTAGRILLDGVDLRDYRIEELHREIGVIFQDFMRYDLPARENIATGQIDALEDRARIERAAAASGADAVLRRLAHGLDQMLGRRFEGGVDLSGGEWQKFALARAYLREAQVLVLDEPSAALDARAEFELFAQFAEITNGRMALLISHRFSTVRMCDRIVVLEGGGIREEGSHAELMVQGGRYASLFEMQASSYR